MPTHGYICVSGKEAGRVRCGFFHPDVREAYLCFTIRCELDERLDGVICRAAPTSKGRVSPIGDWHDAFDDQECDWLLSDRRSEYFYKEREKRGLPFSFAGDRADVLRKILGPAVIVKLTERALEHVHKRDPWFSPEKRKQILAHYEAAKEQLRILEAGRAALALPSAPALPTAVHAVRPRRKARLGRKTA